jgi:hypothetical protein
VCRKHTANMGGSCPTHRATEKGHLPQESLYLLRTAPSLSNLVGYGYGEKDSRNERCGGNYCRDEDVHPVVAALGGRTSYQQPHREASGADSENPSEGRGISQGMFHF